MKKSVLSDSEHQSVDVRLEVALVKIARTLFDYMDAQDSIQDMDRLDPLYENFSQLADNYHNRTGGLHPDLGFQLVEWAALKCEFLSGTAKEPPSKEFVIEYGNVIKKIIEDLENKLNNL